MENLSPCSNLTSVSWLQEYVHSTVQLLATFITCPNEFCFSEWSDAGIALAIYVSHQHGDITSRIGCTSTLCWTLFCWFWDRENDFLGVQQIKRSFSFVKCCRHIWQHEVWRKKGMEPEIVAYGYNVLNLRYLRFTWLPDIPFFVAGVGYDPFIGINASCPSWGWGLGFQEFFWKAVVCLAPKFWQ